MEIHRERGFYLGCYRRGFSFFDFFSFPSAWAQRLFVALGLVSLWGLDSCGGVVAGWKKSDNFFLMWVDI